MKTNKGETTKRVNGSGLVIDQHFDVDNGPFEPRYSLAERYSSVNANVDIIREVMWDYTNQYTDTESQESWNMKLMTKINQIGANRYKYYKNLNQSVPERCLNVPIKYKNLFETIEYFNPITCRLANRYDINFILNVDDDNDYLYFNDNSHGEFKIHILNYPKENPTWQEELADETVKIAVNETIEKMKEENKFVSPGVFFKEIDGNLPPKESFVKDINAKTDKGSGLRFNSDKLRYDLVHPLAHEDMVKVLTYGANKYTIKDENGKILNDGSNNWRKGLGWKSVIASLKRHIAAIEKGEDYDDGPAGSGLLHIAHAACNVHFLNAYYYEFPQGDDRVKPLFKLPKIGLDIDEVICGFLPAWMEKYGVETFPHSWFFDRKIKQKFEDMRIAGELDDFYLNMKPLLSAEDLPFEPHCYITSRPVSKEVTEKWLDMHGFPTKPVYAVDVVHSKVEVAKEAGVEIFIDDSYDNFLDLNSNGIFCYLYTQKHNAKYGVGHMRLNSLHELPLLK